MGVFDNVTFQGDNAADLEAAAIYLYENSGVFQTSFDGYVASGDAVPIVILSGAPLDNPAVAAANPRMGINGPANTAPAYHITVDGITYIGINLERTAELVGAGVPSGWTWYNGDEKTDAELLEDLTSATYVDPFEFFPTDESFWVNNGQFVDGYEDWSQLPGEGEFFEKWAYHNSGAAQAGISFEDFSTSEFYYNWISSDEAFQELISLKNNSVVVREMTLEERLGHEFAHTFINGGLLEEEGKVIDYMNGVREDLGLPPLREALGSGQLTPEDLFSSLAKAGYSVPTVVQILKELGSECFVAGTPVQMCNGDSKPIEEVSLGDLVSSYDSNGTILLRKVTRTFQNEVTHLLDVHGLKVTPGHVTLCGEGQFAGKHVPIIDILLSDGALVKEDASLIRMAINKPVGSLEDEFVKVSFALTSEDAQSGNLQTGEMRVGTLLFYKDDEPVSVLDCIGAEGMTFDPETGLVCRKGQEPEPLYFYGPLPRPEEYILRRSRETLAGILADGEWEGSPSELIAQRLRRTASARLN